MVDRHLKRRPGPSLLTGQPGNRRTIDPDFRLSQIVTKLHDR
jgi:hypothetical protein